MILEVDKSLAEVYRKNNNIVKFRLVAYIGGHSLTHECRTYEQAVCVYNNLEPFIGQYITVMEAFNIATYKWELVK